MTTALKAFLCILGGTLLGFAQPPFQTGVFAAAGFVPLLILLSGAESWGSVFRLSTAHFLSST